MPWIMQMAGFGLLLVGIAFALWVSFWLLLIVLTGAIGFVLVGHVRAFLIGKGILNPTLGVPPDAQREEHATIVEGDFTRVETPSDSPHE